MGDFLSFWIAGSLCRLDLNYPHTAVWGFSIVLDRGLSCRLDLNHPHTAVWGISYRFGFVVLFRFDLFKATFCNNCSPTRTRDGSYCYEPGASVSRHGNPKLL